MICLKHNKEIIGVVGAKSLCEDCVSCEKDFERNESKMFFIEDLDGQLKSYIKSISVLKEFVILRIVNLNLPEICQ